MKKCLETILYIICTYIKSGFCLIHIYNYSFIHLTKFIEHILDIRNSPRTRGYRSEQDKVCGPSEFYIPGKEMNNDQIGKFINRS